MIPRWILRSTQHCHRPFAKGPKLLWSPSHCSSSFRRSTFFNSNEIVRQVGNCLRGNLRSQFFCNSDVEVVFVVVTRRAGCGFGREDVDEAGGFWGDKRGDADPEAHRGGGVDGGRSGQDWGSKGGIRPRGHRGGREGGIVWGGEEKGHGRPL